MTEPTTTIEATETLLTEAEYLAEIAQRTAVMEQIMYYLLAIGLVIILYGMFKFVSKFLNMFF